MGFYLLGIVAPFVFIGLYSRFEIAAWLASGVCPGGAMDQPAAVCGFFEFFLRVFLGGSAAFIVVPAIVCWWAVWTGAWFALRALMRRRRRVSGGLAPR